MFIAIGVVLLNVRDYISQVHYFDYYVCIGKQIQTIEILSNPLNYLSMFQLIRCYVL